MSFTVFIETGLHAGAVQRLGPGLYTVGSELSADIVLSDPDVQSIHVILEVDDAGLRLEPAKGTVIVDGETAPLEPGDERALRLPSKFHIGATTMSVRAPKDAVKTRHRKRLAIGAMAAAVIGVIGLHTLKPLTGNFAASSGPAIEAAPGAPAAGTLDAGMGEASKSSPPATELATSDQAAATSKSQPGVTVDIAAAKLRGRLAAASLDAIDVMVRNDHLVAEGSVEPEKMADWRTVQIWFDSDYGHLVPLVPNIAAAEKIEPPKLSIEAIWTGDTPYLMAGGRRYVEGVKIGDGWLIERIQPEEIVLRRGDQTYSITL